MHELPPLLSDLLRNFAEPYDIDKLAKMVEALDFMITVGVTYLTLCVLLELLHQTEKGERHPIQ